MKLNEIVAVLGGLAAAVVVFVGIFGMKALRVPAQPVEQPQTQAAPQAQPDPQVQPQQPPQTVASPSGIKPEAKPVEDPWKGKEKEAVAFVKNFPVRGAVPRRCPSRIEDIADAFGARPGGNFDDIRTWSEVKVIRDRFECDRFIPFSLQFAVAAWQASGRPPEVVAREVRSDPESLRRTETKLTFSWVARQESGPLYRVDTPVRMAGPRLLLGPFDATFQYAWQINLEQKTLKPLTLLAWEQINSKDAHQWGETQLKKDPTSKDVGSLDVSAVAPTYRLDASAAQSGPHSPRQAPRRQKAERAPSAAKTAIQEASAFAVDPSEATEKAPGVFKVRFATTKGDFAVEVHRDWAPHGADRFYNLVKIGYFTDVSFYRAIDNFIPFGIHGSPEVSAKWRRATIPDDPATGQSNKRSFVTFNADGPNTRTTQVAINLGDNGILDADFPPFGKVVSGMDVVDSLYKDFQGYGGEARRALVRGPDQSRIQTEGNTYLRREFPLLDYVKTAKLDVAPVSVEPSAEE
jgi:peptidyl-prolyl cis-trans isomerase A (cyclophilin A)